MGFGQAGAKVCGGCLKVISWWVVMQVTKEGSFDRKGRFSLLAIENTYLNGVFLNQKLIFLHKRNFNPKVINYF